MTWAQAVEMLCCMGALKTTCDMYGKSPVDYAVEAAAHTKKAGVLRILQLLQPESLPETEPQKAAKPGDLSQQLIENIEDDLD